MSYQDEWRAIAARVRGLASAGELYATFQTSTSSDSYGMGKTLGSHCQSILKSLEEFRAAHERTLPAPALQCLTEFTQGQRAQVIKDKGATREARAGLIFLIALESELTFLLSSRNEFLRVRSERAFLHLQRLLIVDEDHREKWKKAFNAKRAGEIKCEQLGAVHLLWHGLWAFKVDSKGARTDLVFGDELDGSVEPRAVDGLVLTEWKVADETNAAERFKEAREQAELYKKGPLVTAELAIYRYLVIVTLKDLKRSAVPNDLQVGDVTYRHINIAVETDVPSVQARK
jgi:hypothetical protein